MAKYETLIKAVTVHHLSYGEVAARYGVSKTLVHKLHHRWLAEGDAAFEPRSRRPQTTPNRTAVPTRERVIALRDELIGNGTDAEAPTSRGPAERTLAIRPHPHHPRRRHR
ncbi:helix-turn-helix domain-containing protein [Microbacterium aurugineum]|uniref:helix-turn-helix domain-containing protein n=1 Tax=Microbacterium aurugineum TaxID=2851642 RepID=UPI003555EE3B